MRTFSKKTVIDFYTANAQSKEELLIWYAKVEAAIWSDFNTLRSDYPSCDFLGNDRYCFNVKGNHYRVIAMIFFPVQHVYIRGIYTHAQYSKIKNADIVTL